MKSNPTRLRRILSRSLLVAVWTIMAVVLASAAILVSTVRVLTPRHLTPLICRVANSYVDADVSLGRAELAFRPVFPILELRLDSLTVISHAFDALAADQRAAMPAYADTLLSLGSLRAGINLGSMLTDGTIAVHDIEIVRPEINIVLDRSGRGNFDIVAADTTAASGQTAAVMPAVSIKRLSIEDPRAIRYFDAIDSTEVTVLLARADLDGTQAPSYSLHVDGKVHSPIVRQLLQLDDLHIGLDGRLSWDPADPAIVAVEQFRIAGAFMEATVDASVCLGTTMAVNEATFELAPVRLDSLCRFIDASTAHSYGLTADNFATDATIGVRGELLQPFVPERDTVPAATATITVPSSTLRYGAMQLHNLSLELTARLDGTCYDAAVVELAHFTAAGPATSIELSGTFANMLSDPAFDCRLEGDVRLAHLPPVLLRQLEGYLDGHLKVNVAATGRSSMFQLGRFHQLDIRGRADADNIYYLRDDTSRFLTANHIDLRFGSQLTSRDTSARANTLGAIVRVDTADALVGGVTLAMANLSLGLGVENGGLSSDTGAVMPVGGGIRVGAFKVRTLTDSAGMSLRGLHGRVSLRRHRGDSHLPEILLDAGIDRLIAGAPAARFFLRDADLKALTYLRPDRMLRRRQIKHAADSIAAIYPQLPPDSVLALAIRSRLRRPHGPRRVRIEDNNDTESLHFDLAKGFKRYLSDWYLGGELKAARTILRTPFFPVRNRLEHLHLAFSSDSVIVDSLRYVGGSTDLAVSGIVSNMKRVLLGRPGSNLKVNFDISSDTIDINQLAAATFAGAAYADRLRHGRLTAADRHNMSGDDTFGHDFDDAMESSDTIAPILVPVNIDASIDVRARNILYSDLHMNDFSGGMLVYDGAVNINRWRAFSNAGNVELSALYSAPRATEMRCGIGLQLEGFNIERFLNLVPAVDSIMPLMRDFAGTITADIAATVDIDSTMAIELPTLDAALHLSGSDLAFIDADTYRTIGKWLRFRDRADNRIKHMSVQLLVRNNIMQIYPFKFDIDRYTLGVVGSNDLAMNFDYHIAVLKSPIPFKFGITIKGNPDKYKIRLGGAHFNANEAVESVNMVDTVRINLVRQIQNVFRRGVSRSRFARLDTSVLGDASAGLVEPDTLSEADSLRIMQHGMAPDSVRIAPMPPMEIKRRRK